MGTDVLDHLGLVAATIDKLEVIMQLKDFISTAFVDICQGIAEAQKEINSSAIAPQMAGPSGLKHAI